MEGLKPATVPKSVFVSWLKEAIETKIWMMEMIRQSRAKDHQQAFRRMMYDTQEEMDKVVGKFSENSFLLSQEKELQLFIENASEFLRWLGSK
jgi:hypothetical protein